MHDIHSLEADDDDHDDADERDRDHGSGFSEDQDPRVSGRAWAGRSSADAAEPATGAAPAAAASPVQPEAGSGTQDPSAAPQLAEAGSATRGSAEGFGSPGPPSLPPSSLGRAPGLPTTGLAATGSSPADRLEETASLARAGAGAQGVDREEEEEEEEEEEAEDIWAVSQPASSSSAGGIVLHASARALTRGFAERAPPVTLRPVAGVGHRGQDHAAEEAEGGAGGDGRPAPDRPGPPSADEGAAQSGSGLALARAVALRYADLGALLDRAEQRIRAVL